MKGMNWLQALAGPAGCCVDRAAPARRALEQARGVLVVCRWVSWFKLVASRCFSTAVALLWLLHYTVCCFCGVLQLPVQSGVSEPNGSGAAASVSKLPWLALRPLEAAY